MMMKMTIFPVLSFSKKRTGLVDLIEEESWMNPKKNIWRKNDRYRSALSERYVLSFSR
jgi:hypothetical protein